MVARYGEADRARLMADAGIVRSNAKIDAAIAGARHLSGACASAARTSPSSCWGFIGGAPIQNRWTAIGEVPAQTPDGRRRWPRR